MQGREFDSRRVHKGIKILDFNSCLRSPRRSFGEAGGKLKPENYVNSPKTTKDAWYSVLDQSLRREIKEECNLEVGELKYLCDLAFVRPDDIPVITLSYWAEHKSGEVELEADFTEYFWGTVEELKDYDLIEGIYDEIRMVENIIQKSKIKNQNFKSKGKIN